MGGVPHPRALYGGDRHGTRRINEVGAELLWMHRLCTKRSLSLSHTECTELAPYAVIYTHASKHTSTHRIREYQMFLPLAMSTEANTMGIILIDAAAVGQQDTTFSFKLSTAGNTPSKCGNENSYWSFRSPQGMKTGQWQKGQCNWAAEESRRCVIWGNSHDLRCTKATMCNLFPYVPHAILRNTLYMNMHRKGVDVEGGYQTAYPSHHLLLSPSPLIFSLTNSHA